jgi:hypothetical protein
MDTGTIAILSTMIFGFIGVIFSVITLVNHSMKSQFEIFGAAVYGRIADLKSEMLARFEAHDKRFETIDRRFELIDKRFEAIDKRFESVDKRFDEQRSYMDSRFDEQRSYMDSRFDEQRSYVDHRFEDQMQYIKSMDRNINSMRDRLDRFIDNFALRMSVSPPRLSRRKV